MYIIGRSKDPSQEKRAQTKVHITGQVSDPDAILVEIGIGSPQSARVLYDDSEEKIKVLVHRDVRGTEEDLDVVQDDPLYSLLLKEGADIDKFREGIKGRIELLRDEWDKPQTVYSQGRDIDTEADDLPRLET